MGTCPSPHQWQTVWPFCTAHVGVGVVGPKKAFHGKHFPQPEPLLLMDRLLILAMSDGT